MSHSQGGAPVPVSLSSPPLPAHPVCMGGGGGVYMILYIYLYTHICADMIFFYPSLKENTTLPTSLVNKILERITDFSIFHSFSEPA